jgi:hypothetical protein
LAFGNSAWPTPAKSSAIRIEGKRQHDVADPHDQRVDPAAGVAREEAEADADHERQQHRRAADEKRDPGAEHQRREDVATLLVGAEEVLGRSALHPCRRQHRVAQLERRQVERVVRRDHVGEDRGEEAQGGDGSGGDRRRRAPERMPDVTVEKARPAAGRRRDRKRCRRDVAAHRGGVAAGRRERACVSYLGLDFCVIHLKYM